MVLTYNYDNSRPGKGNLGLDQVKQRLAFLCISVPLHVSVRPGDQELGSEYRSLGRFMVLGGREATWSIISQSSVSSSLTWRDWFTFR